jgi:flagellar motor switch protein FliN/FliY
MADEKPLQKEIDELLKAMAASPAPAAAPAAEPSRRAEARGPSATVEILKDVALNVRIELGRTRMSVEDLLRLSAGSVVELDRLAGEAVDVYVNEKLAARGELLVVDDRLAVRITDLVKGS